MANYKPLTAVIETVQQSQAETNGKDCPPSLRKSCVSLHQQLINHLNLQVVGLRLCIPMVL